jgi:para-nitrobenzyl esterase
MMDWPIATLADFEALIAANFPGEEDRVRALYPAASAGQVRQRVAEMFADTQFNQGTWLLAQAMARREPRTWRYLFTRRPDGRTDGPHHGEEVPYAFGNLEQVAGAGPHDRALSDAMLSAWVAFARQGDPNVAGAPEWRRYDQREDNVLEFGDTVQPSAGWRSEQVRFLDAWFGEPAAYSATAV